jgi:hypothetical protein
MHSNDGPVRLQDPAAFLTTIRTEKDRLYALHATILRPAIGGQLFATGPEPTIPSEYADLAHIISEHEAKSMSDHGKQDLAIGLVEGK